MSEYTVIASDRSESFGTFDKYPPALALYKKLEKKRSVGLTCLHGCGCLYRAIMKGGLWGWGAENYEVKRQHVGWRRAEACDRHKRSPPMKKRGQVDNGRASADDRRSDSPEASG